MELVFLLPLAPPTFLVEVYKSTPSTTWTSTIFITQIHTFFRTRFCLILDEYNPQSQRVLGYIYLIKYNN